MESINDHELTIARIVDKLSIDRRLYPTATSTTSPKMQWRRAQNGSPHATYQGQPSAQGIAISRCLLKLTERELQILRLIAEDLPNKEIAKRLGLSVKTIEFHKTRIFDRLEVRGAISAVRLAIREGLIEA